MACSCHRWRFYWGTHLRIKEIEKRENLTYNNKKPFNKEFHLRLP